MTEDINFPGQIIDIRKGNFKDNEIKQKMKKGSPNPHKKIKTAKGRARRRRKLLSNQPINKNREDLSRFLSQQ